MNTITLTSAIKCNPDGIPEQLRQYNQWVVWRLEPPIKPGDKPRKILYDPKRHRAARTHNSDDKQYAEPASATWGTFEQAVKAFRAGRYSGIGFVFTPDDPFIGFDVDDCRDPETGELSDVAERIVAIANTYTEISQSGKGIKGIALASKLSQDRSKNNASNVEMYDRGRYFALTGAHLPGTPTTIEKRQTEFDALYTWWFGVEKPTPAPSTPLEVSPSTVELSDAALIDLARKARNGAKFDALWRGVTSYHHDDHSAADQALCCMLVFWAGRDRVRVDSLFRQSGLMRPKWDSNHGAQTYGEMTVEKAMQSAGQRQQRGKPDAAPSPDDDATDLAAVACDLSGEEWEKHGHRLKRWKSDTDELFRLKAGRWYANAPIGYGRKEETVKALFGTAYAVNIKKWASAVNSWGDDWQEDIPMWVHQELQAVPRPQAMEIMDEYRFKPLKREDIRARTGRTPTPTPLKPWQEARMCYDEQLAIDLVEAGRNSSGDAKQGFALVQNLIRKILREQGLITSNNAGNVPPAEHLDDNPAHQATREMVESAFSDILREQEVKEEEQARAEQWQALGVSDEPESDLLPMSDDESPALIPSVYKYKEREPDAPVCQNMTSSHVSIEEFAEVQVQDIDPIPDEPEDYGEHSSDADQPVEGQVDDGSGGRFFFQKPPASTGVALAFRACVGARSPWD